MSDTNIVVATFHADHNRITMTRSLHQWDRNQVLRIVGAEALPQTFEAHFSNVKHGGIAQTVVGIDGEVSIPTNLLMTGKRIYCWIYVTDGSSAQTEYLIIIPVEWRPMPEYYDVEDTGVFDEVVDQVAEYAATATTGATSATASATAAAGSETAAAASAIAAADSAENAAASEANAEASASAAQASDASAATAATTATAKAAEAAQSATSAGSAADRAEVAQEAAETAQEAAETAATSAATDAATATTKATAAAASATTASTKATDATNAATTATAQAEAAESAKTAAVEAKTAAQSAQSAAETAATTATAKATEAAASATAAAQAAASINTPDSALSDTSINAVQNKVITGELTDVKSHLDKLREDVDVVELLNNKSITNTSTNILPSAIKNENNFCCCCVACAEGDKFTVTGSGGSSTRLWAFSDVSGAALAVSDASKTDVDLVLTAPAGAAYFAFNSKTNTASKYSVFRGVKPRVAVKSVADALAINMSGYAEVYTDKQNWFGGHILGTGEYDENTSYMSISNEPVFAEDDTHLKIMPNGLYWTLRIFKRNNNNYTQLSSVINAQDERTVVIPGGAYYSFDVNRGGAVMTVVRNTCLIAIGNTIRDLADEVADARMITDGILPYEWFSVGAITNGNFYNLSYRVSTPNIHHVDVELTIDVNDGWRFAINYFNNDNEFASDSGWLTAEKTIPAGQKFKLMIRRDVEDTAETADIQTFVKRSVTVFGGVFNAYERKKNYTYAVSGDQIDVRKTMYDVEVTSIIPSTLSQVGAVAYQGTGYSNGTIFQFYKDDYVELIDYSTGSSIAILPSPTKHGNSVAFTRDYYDINDEFPIAIVSDSTSEALAYGVRIQRTAVTLLDTFKFPVAQAGYYGNVVLDALNEVAYVVGYTNNTFSDGTGNKIIVSKWNLHELTDNGDGTKTPEYVDSFTLPFIQTAQGMQFWNGKIFVISSKVSSTEADTKVYVIDPFGKRITSVMESFPDAIKNHETEGICFVDNENEITALIFTGGYNYRRILFS